MGVITYPCPKNSLSTYPCPKNSLPKSFGMSTRLGCMYTLYPMKYVHGFVVLRFFNGNIISAHCIHITHSIRVASRTVDGFTEIISYISHPVFFSGIDYLSASEPQRQFCEIAVEVIARMYDSAPQKIVYLITHVSFPIHFLVKDIIDITTLLQVL